MNLITNRCAAQFMNVSVDFGVPASGISFFLGSPSCTRQLFRPRAFPKPKFRGIDQAGRYRVVFDVSLCDLEVPLVADVAVSNRRVSPWIGRLPSTTRRSQGGNLPGDASLPGLGDVPTLSPHSNPLPLKGAELNGYNPAGAFPKIA